MNDRCCGRKIAAALIAFPLAASAAPVTITFTIHNARGTLGPAGGPYVPYIASHVTFTATGDTSNLVTPSVLSAAAVTVSVPGVIEADVTQPYTSIVFGNASGGVGAVTFKLGSPASIGTRQDVGQATRASSISGSTRPTD